MFFLLGARDTVNWIIWFQLISNCFQLISIYVQLILIYFQLNLIYFQLNLIYFQLISKICSIDLNLLSIDFKLLSTDFNVLSTDFNVISTGWHMGGHVLSINYCIFQWFGPGSRDWQCMKWKITNITEFILPPYLNKITDFIPFDTYF